MPLEFIMSDQEGQGHGIKVCLYGRSGAGKTHLVTTCPNPLLIAAEPGMLTLRNHRIPGMRVRSVEDLTDALEWILHSPEAAQFETIYIDSLSEIAEVVLANAKILVKDARQAYGELIDKMNMVTKAYRDIPNKHVVMVCKQESHVDEVSKMTLYGPAMPGAKFGNQLPYLFDEVFRLGIGRTQEGKDFRFIQTAPDIQYEAKDRSGVLAPIEYPDLGAIFQKILSTPTSNGQSPEGS